MNSITPVLLVGGFGDRLWPLSRKSYPKQFSKLFGDTTLFQQSAQRLTSSDEIQFNPHIIVTNKEFRFIVGEQLTSVGINHGKILIEPESKNTAAAILSACISAFENDNESILLVAPSDHIISDTFEFHKTIKIGLKEAEKGKIVVFGIPPTRPETGYGYLELKNQNLDAVVELVSFVEKPDKNKAIDMIEKGNFLWNAGIFLFRARDMIDRFKKHEPDLLINVEKAHRKGKNDLDFFRLDPNAWSMCKNISIDYAIMEKEKNLVVVPFLSKWTDLGDWEGVWKEIEPNNKGVSISKNALDMNCKNTLLLCENEEQVLVGLGLENIIAVAMSDAVLVARKDMSQDVKKVVNIVKEKGLIQGESFRKEHKPWGWFEILSKGNFFQVKKIFIKPNNSISLQSHKYRSEHWVVVSGNAKVTINDNINTVKKGESVFVPLRAIHRLENITAKPIILIEIQTGTYLGEDDIVRYEDQYSRIH